MRTYTAGEVMTADVMAVAEHASFTTIARILADYHVNAVAVLDRECRVLGVVSEADLLCKAAALATDDEPSPFLDTRWRRAARVKTVGVKARDLMSLPAVTVTATSPAAEAAEALAQRRFRQLPVVDGEGRLVGMITRADVVRAFGSADLGARCLGERGFAVLVGRWRDLRHTTASPSKIGNTVKAALVLTHFEHGRLT